MRFRRHESGCLLTRHEKNELVLGPDLACALAGEPERASLFRSETDRKKAWEAHRDRLCAEHAARHPGSRPWAFWHHDAGRPRHLPVPENHPDSGALRDDAEAESVGFLFAGGYLYPDEIAELRRQGAEAARRIDTDSEYVTTGMGAPHGPDRRAVKVAAAVHSSRTGRDQPAGWAA
jgi:hypothetical protein